MQDTYECSEPTLLKGKGNATANAERFGFQTKNFTKKTTCEDASETKPTESELMKFSSDGGQRTELTRTEKKTSEEEKTTLPTVLDPSFGNLGAVMSDSMNCLNNTVNHLHYCMRNVVPRNAEMDTDIRTLDTEKVRVVAYCAEKIIDIMKLKLEAIKVAKDMRMES
jgi:hypothetical protein